MANNRRVDVAGRGVRARLLLPGRERCPEATEGGKAASERRTELRECGPLAAEALFACQHCTGEQAVGTGTLGSSPGLTPKPT